MQVLFKTANIFGICGMRDVDKRKFPKWVQTILKILYKWSSDQTKLNYNTGKFIEGRRKNFSKFGLRPKNFKVFRVRKNFNVLEAEKFQSVRGQKNFQSGLRPKNFKVLEAKWPRGWPRKFLSAESGQSVHKQVEIRFPVSELGPRVAQRAQVAEVSTYLNAVWQC